MTFVKVEITTLHAKDGSLFVDIESSERVVTVVRAPIVEWHGIKDVLNASWERVSGNTFRRIDCGRSSEWP